MQICRYLLCSVVVLAGCEAVTPATNTPPPAAPAAAAAAKPAAVQEVKKDATPVAKPKPKAARIKNQYIRNGRFEEWTEGLPTHWTGPVKLIEPSSDFRSANHSVSLLPDAAYVLLEQQIKDLPKEKNLRVSAKIKAGKLNDAVLKASYKLDGNWVSESNIYRGTDEWVLTTVELTMPAKADSNSFRVKLLRRPEANGPVLVDDVSVAVVE